MTEEEIFNILLSKNPQPGSKHSIESIKEENYCYRVPGWIFDKEEDLVSNRKSLGRKLKKQGISNQIFFDIFVLGMTDISQRPRCPICGKELEFKGISYNSGEGYGATCGSKKCISENARREVFELWKDSDYKQRQSKSHVDWAQTEEAKLFLRERTLRTWQNEDYRKLQSERHKEYAKNNPDKLRNGLSGTILCNKSISGELHYDSSWEMNLITLLDTIDLIVSVERVHFFIPYLLEGEEFNYHPDFCITTTSGNKYIIEVKANWMIRCDAKTPLKIEAGMEYVKEHSDEFSGYILMKDENLCQGPHYEKFDMDLARKELLKLID